jgi:hypothetical protein
MPWHGSLTTTGIDTVCSAIRVVVGAMHVSAVAFGPSLHCLTILVSTAFDTASLRIKVPMPCMSPPLVLLSSHHGALLEAASSLVSPTHNVVCHCMHYKIVHLFQLRIPQFLPRAKGY